MLVDNLKSLNVDKPSLEELMELSAGAAALKGSYDKFQIEQPDWLSAADRNLTREIRNRIQGDVERRIQEKKAQLAGLETSAEKRVRLQAELSELEKQVPVGV